MRFVTPPRGDVVVAVARSVEREADEEAMGQVEEATPGATEPTPTQERDGGVQNGGADEASRAADAVPSETTDQPAEAGEHDAAGGNE
jgi:DNA gyrase subunit A